MGLLLAPLRWAIRLVTLVVLGVVAYLVVSGYQVYNAQGSTTSAMSAPRSTAIVVFVPEQAAGQASDPVIARLATARTLYLAQVAPRIVVAGPSTGDGLSSAVSWMSSHGLSTEHVSSQPARNLAAALGALAGGLGRGSTVTIATDAVDALVARQGAGAAGLVPVVVAVPGTAHSFTDETGALWNQASSVALGRVVGLSRVPWSAG